MTEAISIQPLINALPTLLGVMIGGIGAYLSNRNLKNIEFNHALKKERGVEKRKSCAEFLSEADRLVIKSMDEKLTHASEMTSLAICLSNVELLCSQDTITAAKLIFEYILNAHAQSNNEQKHHYNDLKLSFITVAKKDISN